MAYDIKSKNRFSKTAFTLWDYNQLAVKHNLNDKDRYIYTQFMKERFPNENDEMYATEWINRFKTGNPTPYMDSISLEVYEKSEKKWKEMMKEK